VAAKSIILLYTKSDFCLNHQKQYPQHIEELKWFTHNKLLYIQCSRWTSGPICWYPLPELLFISEFHAGTYQYKIYSFIFFSFSDVISSFRPSKKYTGTSKFPFRVLRISLSEYVNIYRKARGTSHTVCGG
jgi:hypothetical protein